MKPPKEGPGQEPKELQHSAFKEQLRRGGSGNEMRRGQGERGQLHSGSKGIGQQVLCGPK